MMVLDLPINACSISPSRAYVLIVQMDRPLAEQHQVYSLATKQPIRLPEADQHAYGTPIDWMLGARTDMLVLEPHWLIDLSTGIVTDTRTIDPHKTSPWWTTGPRFNKRNRSPDGCYRIVQGQVSLVPLPGSPLITDTIVSLENPVAELCGNPWEPDSRGFYFLDYSYQARNVGRGPLRFLLINP
nr:hypothetical protein [Herpetosiphon geysericola]